MTVEQFTKELQAKVSSLEQLAKRQLPIKVGALAKRHYQDNFRKGGFVNGGLKPWQRSKRQSGGGSDASYGTLLSRERNLMQGIKYVPGNGSVVVSNPLVYAPTHNWGGVVHPNVTPKMRKFAWAMHYKAEGEEADKWKRLALTKKQKLSIKIPQRQFLGESEELNTQIQQTVESELNKIINK